MNISHKLLIALSTTITIALPISQCAQAASYVVNNENIDKDGRQAYTGSYNRAALKQQTVKQMGPQNREAFKEDKLFKAPKNKQPIRKSENRSQNGGKQYSLNDQRTFTTIDNRTNQDEQTTATLKYDGKKAQVWVADQYITDKQAQNIGREFDERIDPLIENNFGEPSDVDNNGKVNILVYDIKDNYDQTGTYIGGYFHPRDLYNVRGSNHSEIFYMDTYPSMGTDRQHLNESQIYSTLAHEYQHMVNANENLFKEQSQEEMDPWLNEALSMASEQMYLNAPLNSRIDYYNNSKSIAYGHSLIRWDEQGDTLSNYSLSYLFIEYLKKQSDNGEQVFKELINDPGDTNTALQNAIHEHVDPNLSLSKFMTNFRIALVKKENSGPYGFKGDADFNNVHPQPISQIPETLAPQGSVLFQTNQDFNVPNDKDEDVSYNKVN